jgi:RNA polymerase sigma-70 factor (ECF subfamily)
MLEAVRTATRSALGTENRSKLVRLREELTVEDRTLLVLRVDRKLEFSEIALAFATNLDTFTDEDKKRESARLRKRFQLVKQQLVSRARKEMGEPS